MEISVLQLESQMLSSVEACGRTRVNVSERIHIESGAGPEAFIPKCRTVLQESDGKITFCQAHLSASKTKGWLFIFKGSFLFP